MIQMYDIKPIEFYPYTSCVMDRICEIHYHSNSDEGKEIQYYRRRLIETFNHAGIKCYDDNKIAFEIEYKGQRLFYGFYDLTFSIGFRVERR